MEGDPDPTSAAAAMIPKASIRRIKPLLWLLCIRQLKAQPVNELEKPIPITHQSQLLNNPYLGLPLQVGSCQSCGSNAIEECEGHFGFIELPMPIFHPSHVTELSQILNLICLRCLKIKNRKKSTLKGSKFTSCSHCQELPPLCVAEVKKSNGARGLELRASIKKELEEGFWSFLDQFGSCTRGTSHCRPLLPEEGHGDDTFTSQPTAMQWKQRMKTLFISKSSSFSSRGVITGDPYIGLNVVGVQSILCLLFTGDPRVEEANLVRIEPESTYWVQSSGAEQKGEVALEITVEKAAAAESGNAWGVAMDACIPVMDLIDTTRSVPYDIQQVRQVFGISSVFEKVTQHLSKSVGMVTKSVLQEHLTTVASSMTCTGDLHGFNSSGYKATCQSLKVQTPFMEATLSRSIQCFEKAAAKACSDQLDNVVSACSWGNNAEIGTGSAFEILWNDENMSSSKSILGGYGLYDFLEAVETTGATEDKAIVPHNYCLYDVDCIPEDKVSLEGNNQITWTDKPKAEFLTESEGRRAGMHSTGQKHPRKPNWHEGNTWSSPNSTAVEFAGQVFQRRQLKTKSNWNSGAPQQDDKPSWYSSNSAGTHNFTIAGSSRPGEWNRKNNNRGRGGGRAVWKSEASHRGGSNSNRNQGGGRAVWKSEASHRGSSSNRNRGGGRAAWKSEASRHGGSMRQVASCAFTPVEQQIFEQIEPITKNVKRIIRESRDGIKLPQDDEKFIVTNVLMYHPERKKKIAGNGNYITVDRHQVFHGSRCLYVMSSDGSRKDFSYKKCLENYIRAQYPDAADSFCRKYFK